MKYVGMQIYNKATEKPDKDRDTHVRDRAYIHSGKAKIQEDAAEPAARRISEIASSEIVPK